MPRSHRRTLTNLSSPNPYCLTKSDASRSAHTCHPRRSAAASAGTSVGPLLSLSTFHTTPEVEASNIVPLPSTQWRTTWVSWSLLPLRSSGLPLLLFWRSTTAKATAETPGVVRCRTACTQGFDIRFQGKV